MTGGALRAKAADRLWPLACVLAAIATYLPSLSASFQFDDWSVIVGDGRVASAASWAASMPGIRPLLKLTYALNNELGGQPAQFRAVNIAVHATNTLLVYALLHTLAASQGRDPRVARSAAVASALIFALHPVQTEAVTYVSGRSSSLSACFALASLLLWARSAGASRPLWRWIASLLLFALALAVKETVVVLPLAMALWYRVAQPLSASSSASFPFGRAPLAPAAAHLALSGVALAVALAWQPYQRLLEASVHARGIGTNLLTQADAIFWFFGQLACVTPINPDPALPAASVSDAAPWMRAFVILSAIAAGIHQLRRRPALGFGTLWFFLWLLPTNSVLPRLDVANDRQLYVALIGPAWLVGLAAAQLAPGQKPTGARLGPIASIAMQVALVGALAFLTIRQNRIYADEVAFWEAVAQRSPASARAADNLGIAYAIACRPNDAAREFDRAVRLDPQDVRARVNARLLHEGTLPAPALEAHCGQHPRD